MNLEIGTDIIAISRIRDAIAKFGMGFLERFLLPSEILLTYKNKENLSMLCNSDSKSISHEFISTKTHFFTQESLDLYTQQIQNIFNSLKSNFAIESYRIDTIAGFWAIKEACSKALGVGIGKELGFHDICIYKDMYGKPHLALHENKYNTFQIQKIAISMSHDSSNAIAVCVITFSEI